ncbi:N-acetylmuramoyl-L-alanine amidase family protein [Paenibacillus xerothermodurans]|uniref:AMIN domain-containing protein n=1 Tax=Paenibacillus xerothermodurans TaxID=1977292 RepID=A0A2W1ND77_PAEXE|nr:N-acetylmuramoyl-L-alanine amidase family protein [Paenibacillus xerothermodurans]PZE21904.1 AMIN domain-containing protein [Paenibacillus xerothermodurans]
MRVLTALISLLLMSILALPVVVFGAEQPIQLFLNGKQLSAEVAPRIIKDNTVVPIRIIAESLGSKVKWEEKSRKVTVAKANTTIQLYIDKKDVTVNQKSYKLETPPTIVEGSTMLPLRFIGEQLGLDVTWDDLTRSVFLKEPDNAERERLAAASEDREDTAGEATPADGEDDAGGADSGKNITTGAASAKSEDKKPASSIAANPGAVDGDRAPIGAVFSSQTTTGEAKAGASASADKPANTAAAAGHNSDDANEAEDVQAALSTVHSLAVAGDRFVVNTSGGKAIPELSYESEPHRVVINIPHGQLDPELKLGDNGQGTIKIDSETVSQIRYSLFSKEPYTVRIIVDLTKKVVFKPVVDVTGTQLAWTLIPPKDKYRVVIDPGHGGKDTGAISVNERREKDFVLSLGLKIEKLLQKEPKIEALLTRTDDTFVELADRAAFANDREADVFVSVHGNAAAKESVRGVETYYYTEQSMPFASIIHEHLLEATGFPDRKVKQSGFYVVKNTTMPSVLLEVGFLSNQTEESIMYQDAFQNKVAASIVAAIKQQLKIG